LSKEDFIWSTYRPQIGVCLDVPIQFSDHALEKMRRRGIKRSYVYETLKTPDELYQDIEHDMMIAVKKINDKFVILAYGEADETVKVITVYYTAKLDKLIRSKTVRRAWKRVK